jgi:glycosyltransferase involved in cell wall biosynthesis
VNASATPAVSVVICTRDRGELLLPAVRTVIASMDEAARHGLLSELVVVDNASTDDTPRVLADLQAGDDRVRAVVAERPGLGSARNVGVRAARASVVLFTDDDVRVHPGWVRSMAVPLLADEADVVSSPVLMADHLQRGWMTPALRSRYYAHVELPEGTGHTVTGASMGARRDVLAETPFDEELATRRYPGHEDTLFYFQCGADGRRILSVTGTVVEHHFTADRLEPARLAAQASGYGRGDAFLHHHWLHSRFRAPRARLIAHRVRLQLLRVRHRADPYAEALVEQHRAVAFHRTLLDLRHEPVRYDLRGHLRNTRETT